MATITLHCIANDEKEKIEQIIEKYKAYFDKLDFAIDDDVTFHGLVRKYKSESKIRFFCYGERMESGRISFGDKRNFLAEQCKTDYYFRLDTDDIISNPDKIKDVLEYADKNGIAILTCYYEYSKDEWGNIDNAHYRETIIRNDINLVWNKPIHECIIPKKLQGFVMEVCDDIRIVHNIDKEHGKKSTERNLAYLLEEFERDGSHTDPRTIAYLGRTYAGLGKYAKAVYFLEKHINTSGWDEDRYSSWCLLSDIFNRMGDKDRSVAAAFEALHEKPDYPDAYFLIHDIYFMEEKWQKAKEWAEMGFSKPVPKTNIPTAPALYTWRPMLSLAECYAQLGDYERAWQIFLTAKKYVPTLDFVKDNEKVYREAVERQRYVDKFTWLLEFLKDKAPDRVKDLVKSIPKTLHEHALLAKIIHMYQEPRVWKDKELAIFCGGAPEHWSPKSTLKGVGGSEEAVIYLSKELTKIGWKVTVYNDCGDDEGNYEGVEYVNWIKFNPRDHFNVLVSWRSNIFNYSIQAKHKVVWVHDLPITLNLDDESVKFFDKIVVLSKYHASLLPPCVPKEKIYISSNGIIPEDFKYLESVKREPLRCIYASSYNRGLEEMLTVWGEVNKEVPEAELHIYYGWEVYDAYVKRGWAKDDGWKARMQQLLKQPNVFEHGRIGHRELVEQYAKSGVFSYFCTYAGEINCIALTKAIAAGCFPVTNEFAVMNERNTKGTTAKDLKTFKENWIKALKEKRVSPVLRFQYINDNSWKTIAEDWSLNVLRAEIPTEIIHRIDWIRKTLNPTKRIVDIGCNNGAVLDGWNRDKIVSVDIDSYDLPNFVRADASKLPFADNNFDVALLAEIVEHTKDPIQVLKEARRVSKSIVLTVPYEHEWAYALKPFNTLEKESEYRELTKEQLAEIGNPTAKDFHKADGLDHLYHETFYTPELLKEHLEKVGFKNIKITRIRKSGWTWLGATADA